MINLIESLVKISINSVKLTLIAQRAKMKWEEQAKFVKVNRESTKPGWWDKINDLTRE